MAKSSRISTGIRTAFSVWKSSRYKYPPFSKTIPVSPKDGNLTANSVNSVRRRGFRVFKSIT